jgi:hypothetical protein
MFSQICGMRQIIALLIVTVSLNACSNKLFESNWKKPATKDKAFRFYHTDSKIRYNIENDENFLYVSFDVQDQLTVQKILTTGLRLHLDGTGKNKEKNEIQFPIYSDKVPVSELEEYGTKYDQSILLGKARLDQMIPTDGYVKFGGKTQPIFNGVSQNGITVTLEFDKTRSLVYSAKIPLATLALTTNLVSIGLETGGYEMPQQDVASQQANVTQANQGPTAGDRAMGRGGSDQFGTNTPGASTAAGTALRNSTSYNSFIEPIRFWVKAQMATKK